MSQFDTENKDVVLATALATGASASAAARQMDLSISTVKRRMADPDFRKLVCDLRQEVFTAALGRMTDNMTRAADAVSALLDAEQPAVRLRAARTLLTLGLKLQEALELTDRIRDLEEEVARKQGYAA
jgi:hypothetical protein